MDTFAISEEEELETITPCLGPRLERHREGVGNYMRDPIKRAFCIFIAWFLLGLYMYTSRGWGDKMEPYTVVQSCYLMAQIITTVGYGDLTPAQPSGFMFTTMYVLTAVVTFTSLVSVVADAVQKSQEQILKKTVGSIGFNNRRKNPNNPAPLGGLEPRTQGRPEHFRKRLSEKWQTGWLRPDTKAFLMSALLWFAFVLIGTFFFALYGVEEKTLCEAFYMSVITLTTVGFGDKHPVSSSGQIFATFWMLLGVSAYGNMVARFSARFMARDNTIRKLDNHSLQRIFANETFQAGQTREEYQDPKVRRADFILFLLEDTGVVDSEVIQKLGMEFNHLDLDGNGYLDRKDIDDIHQSS